MKKILAMITVACMIAVAMPGSAAAGSRTRYRWEGAGIVLGTIGLLGILSTIGDHTDVTVRYQDCRPPRPYYPRRQDVWVPGHWEWIQVWVPGSWETVWIPGGHDGYGTWRPGRWDRRENGGRYVQKKVWVERR